MSVWTRLRGSLLLGVIALLTEATGSVGLAQSRIAIDLEEPPFEYLETEDDNRVSRLIEKLASKEIKLEYSPEHGYLRALLAALDIPASSQTLVFSKTSMQVQAISRRNPRAIYFNDDTYLGWVHGSSLMEISTVDPKLGAAFYTVDMMPWRAKVERVDYDCLGCHATSMTQGIPGHTVRSVLPAFDGSVDVQKESFVSGHGSPFRERWGGWYVTGRHGDMRHMGNAIVRGGGLDTRDNGNRLSLRGEFDTSEYLSPYSDIVALMVLEHQSQMQNAMTRANFSVRQLRYDRRLQDERAQRESLRSQRLQGEKTAESEEEWQAQLQLIAKEVVDYMLFCDETPLTGEVKGLITFANEFTARGPKDSRGRSLREFDMQTRMFKYPCSYLIYSSAFEALDEGLRQHVIAQLLEILEGRNGSPQYDHLTPDIRREILEILRETHPGFKTSDTL